MQMKQLLENDFPAYYHIGRRRTCVACITDSEEFDLIDAVKDYVVAKGQGNVSFRNHGLKLQVLGFEKYLDQFAGTHLSDGHKRCDYIMEDVEGRDLALLCEITSAKNSYETLLKPIPDKNGNVAFTNGKYEKAELQLYDTLSNIMPVPSISAYISKKKRKICLMAYSLNKTENQSSAALAFNRPRAMEAAEAGDTGAQISSPQIEAFGFTYYRICHQYSFCL